MWEYKLKNEALVKFKSFPRNIADNVSYWVLLKLLEKVVFENFFNQPVWLIPF